MTGPHSDCTPEEGGGEREGRGGGGEREEGKKGKGMRRKEGEETRKENRGGKWIKKCVLYRWKFTFGISIDELALRYDTCLRERERECLK